MDYIYENDNSFSKYLSKCFMWMFIGLLISFATGAIFNYTGLFVTLFSSFGSLLSIGLMIVEVILVISLSRQVFKLNTKKAISMFILYSFINGITLASIFFMYNLNDIFYVFLATAGIFGVMALLGYTTKLDLSKLGTFISVALIGLIVSGIILMFAFSETFYVTYSILGIALFMIITAYDIHILKRMYYRTNTIEGQNALAIYGALQLYLDFINIFIRLLSLFARARD